MYYRSAYGSKREYEYAARQRRTMDIRMSKPTETHKNKDAARKFRLDAIAERRLQRANSAKGGLTASAREAFDLYRLEHDMYTERAKTVDYGETNHDQGIFKPGDKVEKKGVLQVDARGNLIDDLPIISLVNRSVFEETFSLYYSRLREGLWVKWKVRNLDFFPFLRFYRALTAGKYSPQISQSRLHIEFETEKEEIDDRLHASKFFRVKRLVELHWLDGCPLWGCLTGLSDRQDCKGPFGDYMYSVRQIVALYRTDYEAWKSLSIKYLYACRMMDEEEPSTDELEALSDAELIEAVIDMLYRAIEYNLGYGGSYSRVGRDKTEWNENAITMFSYKGSHVKVAYEKEHAIVHVVGQYRKRVDKELRERLAEAYEEWEELPDKEGIPEGVVL